MIFDPAMPNNNLGAHLGAHVGDRLGVVARRSLRRLAKAAALAERGRGRASAEHLSAAFDRPGLFSWTE